MKTIQPIYKNIIATIVAIIIALVSIFAVEPSDCRRIFAIKLKTTCPDCKMKNYYNKSDTAKLFWRAVPIRFFWLEQKTAYNEFQRKYAIYLVYFLYIF